MLFKKITPVVLICSFVLFSHSVVYAATTPPDSVVLALNAKGVMVGFGDGYMGWDDTLTRAQAAKIIVTAMDCSGLAKQSVSLHPIFPDVDRSHWAFGFVNLACEFGIIKGFPDGSFKPEKQVTRAEYLVMLSRMYSALGGVGMTNTGLPLIEPKWMAEEVSQVLDLISLLNPKQGESFDIDMMRAEAGILVHGLMEKFGLVYDLMGTLIDVRQNEIVIRQYDSNRTVTIPLSDDAKCVKGEEQVALSEDTVGEEVHIVLNRLKCCALIHID